MASSWPPRQLSDPVVRRVRRVLGAPAHRAGDPRRLGHGGGGPLGALVRHQLARAPARPDGARGYRPRGWPTATSTRCARCSRPPPAQRSRSAHKSVGEFLATLEQQEIPADTLAERGIHGESVRLLTAHRSKGLEWRLVVVAHVQETSWPDLRRRTSLLQADRIGAERYAVPVIQPETTTRELLAEERRLFYVACTRACERLVVTAVASPDDEGEQPSRFLTELGVEVRHHQGRPPRPLSLLGLVSELRRTASDPAIQPDDPRRRPATARPSRGRAPSRRTPPRPGCGPGDLVGDPRPEPCRAAGAPGRRTGRAVGQRPRRAGRVPGEVVPRARGRRPRPSPARPRASATWCTRSPTGSPRASSHPTPARWTS